MSYLANHHDAEDVLVDSFTKVFRNLSKFQYRGDDSLTKWISTIVINESIRLLNRRKPIKFEEDMATVHSIEVSDDIISNMEAKELYAMIEKLPAGYRTIFNLYVIEGYSHKEIAEMLRISQNTSKSQLSKARKYLINKIKEEVSYENA
jgi:RNA polymerase sigma-70 factor (ECF subfamily)